MLEFLISSANAQDAATQKGSPFITIAMFGGLFVIMYFMMIRPQRKRQKEHQELTSNLSKGDEVVLTSGMLGKIVKVSDDYVSIDTGSVEMQFQKTAVHALLVKGTIKGVK